MLCKVEQPSGSLIIWDNGAQRCPLWLIGWEMQRRTPGYLEEQTPINILVNKSLSTSTCMCFTLYREVTGLTFHTPVERAVWFYMCLLTTMWCIYCMCAVSPVLALHLWCLSFLCLSLSMYVYVSLGCGRETYQTFSGFPTVNLPAQWLWIYWSAHQCINQSIKFYLSHRAQQGVTSSVLNPQQE